MNRLVRFALAIAIGLCVGVSAAAWAHLSVVGDGGADHGSLLVAYGFAENEIPTLDGDLGDWEATVTDPAFWITTEALTVNDWWKNGVTYDLDDLAVRFALGWAPSTNRLYLGAEVRDNLYVSSTRGGGLRDHHSDNIEWNIDADHSGGDYACLGLPDPEEARHANSQAQQWLLDPFYGVAIPESRADPWVSVPPYTDAHHEVIGEHNSGPVSLVYEAYATPWDDLNPEGATESTEHWLEVRTIIHMQVNIADFDSFNEEGRAQYHAYSNRGGGYTWNTADNQVDFLLVEPPDNSAVAVDSWAAIKATFAR